MAYVPVPKDLTKVKTKVMFNLTKRQLVCFSLAALVGLPLFFVLNGPIGVSGAVMCMMFVMMPFFLLAVYERNGQPLEKRIHNMIQVTVVRPKHRAYRTNNFYAVLQRQEKLEEEVQNIVCGNQSSVSSASRKKRKNASSADERKQKPVPRRTKMH